MRPLKLDVRDSEWPVQTVDYVFSANTAHIMSWPEVELMFAGIARVLRTRGMFALYGPFNRDGQFTSESNRAFDAVAAGARSADGVRDDQATDSARPSARPRFTADYSMPANNRLLVWTKWLERA